MKFWSNGFNLLVCIVLALFITGWQNVQPVAAASVHTGAIVETIATGSNFGCRIKNDNTIRCWGYADQGLDSPPAGNFTQLSAGFAHACALKSDGSLVCWGFNDNDRATPPLGTFTQLSVGAMHGCALKSDNTVACWGAGTTNTGTFPDYGQSIAPGGTFTQVSAGGSHSCGVKSDSSIVCWGRDNNGQTSSVPSGAFTQVSAGASHTCGIKDDATVVCWGANDYGQSSPVPSGTFLQVKASDYYTCGLKSDGTIACWGNDPSGASSPPSGVFSQISAGSTFACGMKSDNSIVCWGLNTSDQLYPLAISGNTQRNDAKVSYVGATSGYTMPDINGDYSFHVPYNWSGSVTPSVVSSPEEIKFLPASRSYTNLTDDQTGQNYIRGAYISGYVGVAGAILSYTDGGPKTVTADGNGNYTIDVPYNWFGTITPSLGGFHFAPTSRTYTNLTLSQLYEHYAATSGVAFPQIDAGGDTTCQLKSDGKLKCWGNNDDGQANAPAGVFTQVSVGSYHACAIRTNGTLACWGSNGYKESTPPAGVFTQVSAGMFYTCALKSNGIPVCWGNNDMGQTKPVASGTFKKLSAGANDTCGIRTNNTIACWGGTVASDPPVGTYKDLSLSPSGSQGCAIQTNNVILCWPQYSFTPPSGAFWQISMGNEHLCGLKSNRTVGCSGTNKFGQAKPPAGTFIQVSAGNNHSCALKSDESVICWGANDTAQLEPGKVGFRSDAGFQDGWILESSETSGKGGTLDSTAATLILGDDKFNRQYKAILSFHTEFLPDNAALQSATLKIMRYGGQAGSNPFTVLGNLLVDIRRGPFGTAVLQLNDFNSPASAVKVATFSSTPVANWHTANLNAVGLANISKVTFTQMRLYFTTDDNNNNRADYLTFGSGNSPSGDPVLIIAFTTP